MDFLLKSLADSQDNDQPDYDSVPSDEDTDQDLPSSKGDRTKVTSDTQDAFNSRQVRMTTTSQELLGDLTQRKSNPNTECQAGR